MEISRLIDIQEVIFYEHSEYISLRDGDTSKGIRIILGSRTSFELAILRFWGY